LSVNVNKVATLRNSRGGSIPSVLRAVETCLAAGAPGITVHPRADERHIRPGDVLDIARLMRQGKGAGDLQPEFNIEGDPREGFLDLVLRASPDQCTLVPVVAGELTSQGGWPADTRSPILEGAIRRLADAGVRVSVFIDADPAAVRWAAGVGAHRVELYTEPFARAFAAGGSSAAASFAKYSVASAEAAAVGLGVNAGHDLDLENLRLFRTLPHLDEVSIGHALISDALWVGLHRSVCDYLAVLKGR
jgi:pyridoxine 5-phosphate synthase